ncbi:MAG: PKD domain-containing protein, partial [Acidobacteria bacterium]|nr:PKD domain-containing protein [Acidobacteriota bacterium]
MNSTKGYFQSAAVLGDELGINFDTELIIGAGAPAPAVGSFTVEVEGASRSVTNIARRGRTATLTLASAVSAGENVTVGYAKPATNPLKTTAGEVAAFSDEEVLNLTGRLPAITSVTITSTPGVDTDGNGTPDTYGLNETIDIDVEFDNPVEVIDDGSAGNVYVRLDMAPNNTLDLAADRRAVPFHATGRGDRIMRFRYTVEAADQDADGVFVQPDPNNNTVVFLSSGAAVHAPGLSEAVADLTLAGLPFAGDPSHRVDGSRQAGDRTPPEVSGATADATTLKVTFDETLDASSAPAGDAFTVSGGRTGTGTAMISGDTATVTLDSAVLKDETVTVSYEQPATSPLQDAAGNAVASFSDQSVTNLTERERPIADAGDDVEADPDERVTLDGSASTDPNGDRLTFAWTQVDGETVTLSGANSARLSFTAPAGAGVLTFRLTVTDPNGLTDTDEVSVFVGSPPQAGRPVADAGDDVEVEPGARVTFNGANSSAPEDGSLSYTWQQLAGPSVRLDGAASAQVSFTAPREPGVLVFRLTVTSEAGLTDTDDVRAIVGGLRPPVADAGNDLEAEPGQRVTLDGTGSTDPAGYGLTFAWEQTAGERVALSGTDSARLSFTAPETPGSLTFRLRVTDHDGLFDTDKVTVTVGDRGVSFGDAEIGTLNLSMGERIEPVRLPEASGGNGTLRYSLRSQPPGFAGLDYDAHSRWLTGVPRDAGTFTFTWRATDADGDTATVIFLVVVNSTPSAHAGNDIAVEPGGYVRLDGSRSADPNGDILTFAWTQIRGEQVTLPDPSYVQPSFTAPWWPEALVFRLTVTDPSGLSDSDEVTVTVRDTAPTFGNAVVSPMVLDLGHEIAPVGLPVATGGNGALSYDLASDPAGLAGLDFEPQTRELSGTPHTKGRFVFTYRADDEDGNRDDSDAALLTFVVTVQASREARKKALTRTLAAVGSSALSSALDSIGSRFVDTTPGTSVVLGGQHISFVAADGHRGGRSGCPAGGQGSGMNRQRDAGACGYQSRAAGWSDLMSSSSFSMALNEPASPTLLGVWGGGDLMAFEGAPDPGTRYQGEA